MKRIFIIHGWAGSPKEPFYQHLKQELQSDTIQVFPLEMPKATEPEINAWVTTLAENIQTPDAETILYGHSIGTQTVMRYLQSLNTSVKIKGCVFTAPFIHMKPMTFEGPWKESEKYARPWLNTPINFKKIKTYCDTFTCIFSDDDPFVPLEDKEIFARELNAKIMVEHNKAHSPGADGAVVQALKELAQ